MRYFNTPAQVVAALRAVADDLAAMPAAVLPDLVVSVDIQASASAGTNAERAAAVDALATALTGHPGQTEVSPSGGAYHRMPFDRRHRPDGLHLAIFTALLGEEVTR